MRNNVKGSQFLHPCQDPVARKACLRVPPLFDLRDMVAVNPFLGYLDQNFFDAMLSVERIFHEPLLPGDGVNAPRGPRVLCVADVAENRIGSLKANAPRSALLRFLGARADDRTSATFPFSRKGLFDAFMAFARHDRSVDARGLGGYRKMMTTKSGDAAQLFSELTGQIRLKPPDKEDYFSRLLARVPGYGGLLRGEKFSRDPQDPGQLPELLTILLLQDHALARILDIAFAPVFQDPESGYLADRKRRLHSLEEAERQLHSMLADSLKKPSQNREVSRLQLAFCIDVRSERFRRHLEGLSDSIETFGLAGFFGLPMQIENAHGARPHCPPLLEPSWTVHLPTSPKSDGGSERDQFDASFHHALTAPVSTLTHVETWGLSYVPRLLADAFPSGSRPHVSGSPRPQFAQLDMAARVGWAEGFLAAAGFGQRLAPLVVIVGHGSSVTNNPQAAGLACGACAGHSGGTNARLAAQVLNDPEVRAELKQRNVTVEDSVHFLAAEHDTMTDEIVFFDDFEVPTTHLAELKVLEGYLKNASHACRRERSATVPGLERVADVQEALARRSLDPAETQPEWALAGNAGFFIGSRELCRGQSLDGRVFLHSYREELDPDGRILEMILTAPVVVGSWINLQYYASTTAPKSHGAGNKTLHNLLGNVGVIEGGEGDLAVGLSLESLTTRGVPVHQPLRLQVMVQASASIVIDIVRRNESVRQLVSGRWIQLSIVELTNNGVRIHPLAPDIFHAPHNTPE